MSAVSTEPRQVSRCWHPEPQAELLAASNGSNVAVFAGEPAYQLSSGETIAL